MMSMMLLDEDLDPAMDFQCQVYGCTTDDCTCCVLYTGEACGWVEIDLCSVCAVAPHRGARAP